MLCNPVCTVGYAVASWKFFYERIRNEEYHLIRFFGDEYIQYMREVPTRIPFNSGLEPELKEMAS